MPCGVELRWFGIFRNRWSPWMIGSMATNICDFHEAEQSSKTRIRKVPYGRTAKIYSISLRLKFLAQLIGRPSMSERPIFSTSTKTTERQICDFTKIVVRPMAQYASMHVRTRRVHQNIEVSGTPHRSIFHVRKELNILLQWTNLLPRTNTAPKSSPTNPLENYVGPTWSVYHTRYYCIDLVGTR